MSKLFFELGRYDAVAFVSNPEDVIFQTRILTLVLRDLVGWSYLHKINIIKHVDGKEYLGGTRGSTSS